MTNTSHSGGPSPLLTALLRRLMALDEQLAQQPDSIAARLDRDDTAARADQTAASLGLGTLATNLPAIAKAAGLRAELRASLERQRQSVAQRRNAIELQQVLAAASARVTLDLQLQAADRQLAEIERVLRQLDAAPPAAASPLPPPQPDHPTAPQPAPDPPALRQLLTARFSLSEIRTLAFDLGVDPEDLGGDTKADLARKLVAHLQDRERLDDLVREIRRTRPDIRM